MKIRTIFDSIPSLPLVGRRVQHSYRGNDDYLGVEINDPWRDRYQYRTLELIPDRGIIAQFINGYATLYNGDVVEWYIDVDRKLEKKLLEILFRHDQRKWFTMLNGEKFIDI